jgi:hypothetical protein
MTDRAKIEALARDVEAFPGGRVRAEARLFLAEAWQRIDEPERALAALAAAVEDPTADRLTRALALSELWALRRQRGEIGAALAEVDRDPDLSPAITKAVRRAARRERLRVAASVVLAALGAIGAASIARLMMQARDVRDLPRQIARPGAVAFALYLGGAGAILVHQRGGDARPFLWLGLGVLALLVIARAFTRAFIRGGALRAGAARAAWAAACIAGVIAAAFLAVERTEVSYLEGLGL